jgi:AcrR family transcriptional regulator
MPSSTPVKKRMSGMERRDQILGVAAAVFGRLGFEAARMEDVAKEAGIAKGLLYKHFESKDSLFRALADKQGQAYAADLRSALADSDVAAEPGAALQSGLGFWLQMLSDQSASFNLTDPGVHDAYEGMRESLRAVIADAIRVAAPTVSEPYPKVNVQVLVSRGGGIQGPSVKSWVSTPKRFSPWLAAVCR